MVDSRIVLATAGSGKTYYIANHLDDSKKNLIITYTNQNVKNLLREIELRFGCVPQNTMVLTFSSFIYRWLIKPAEPILIVGDKQGVNSDGVDVVTIPEPNRLNGKYNPKYYKQDNYRHYLSKSNMYYVNRISALFNKQPANIKKIIFERLATFCDVLFFDELQDFMGDDFVILKKLIQLQSVKVIAVGDFYQHSVSKTDFKAIKPFKKNKKDITKEEYLSLFGKKVDVDESLLRSSRRVPEVVCSFITKKLGINIFSSSKIQGNLQLISEQDEIERIISSDKIVKLVYSGKDKYMFSPINTWSYCKGDTYKNTCVILTRPLDRIFEENFTVKKMSSTQIHKLYVALTRATHNVYLIRSEDYKKYKLN